MNALLADLFRRSFDLTEHEGVTALSRFSAPAVLPNDLLVGRRVGGPVDMVIGGPCTRNDLGGVSLGTVYQILVPLWTAAQLNVPAAVFLGVGEEALVNPRRSSDYVHLGRRLRAGIEAMAADYGVSVEVVDTSEPEISEAIELARSMQSIVVSEPQSRWLYELSARRDIEKKPHSMERVHATGKVVTCHTPSFLRSFFGYANPLVVEDIEVAAAALFAETFDRSAPADALAFLPLPNLQGNGPMFRSGGAARIVLPIDGSKPQLDDMPVPVDVRVVHDCIATMLPGHWSADGAAPLDSIVTYAVSRFAQPRTNESSRHLKGLAVTVTERNKNTADVDGDDDAVVESARPLLASGAVVGRRMLSGLQPSGTLHLGNYYGAMQQHIEGQSDNDGYFFIANYHAMTTVKDRGELARSTVDVALDYLALGLDPNRVALYRQSDLPEVAELAWILGCVASFGDLERAVSYKDKVNHGIVPNVGLFTYPVLMASDILIVRADVVPVGEDQIQHIEMTRRFASRFNRTYGRETFVIPQARINEAKLVPGIDGQKMSKSYGNAIPLFGEPQLVRELMFTIKTDSSPVEAPKDPDSCLAFSLLRLMAMPDEAAEWRTRYLAGGLRYSDVKRRLVELYEQRFGMARERRRELAANPKHIEEILLEGVRKVRKIACAVMEDVRDAVGIDAIPNG